LKGETKKVIFNQPWQPGTRLLIAYAIRPSHRFLWSVEETVKISSSHQTRRQAK